jgi:hypothetical protein
MKRKLLPTERRLQAIRELGYQDLHAHDLLESWLRSSPRTTAGAQTWLNYAKAHTRERRREPENAGPV